jgi:hypothetical protein
MYDETATMCTSTDLTNKTADAMSATSHVRVRIGIGIATAADNAYNKKNVATSDAERDRCRLRNGCRSDPAIVRVVNARFALRALMVGGADRSELDDARRDLNDTHQDGLSQHDNRYI